MICNSYFGELMRMTQFKDKSVRMKQGNGTEMVPVGLFTYPSLMAADILLYDADVIPVGKDQKQHVELARNLAERFNKKFGNTFRIPTHYSPKSAENILDLTDVNHKMSKSLPPKGTILLSDSQEDIEKKIKGALTDSFNKVKYDTINQPAISNLITIYSILGNISVASIEKKFANAKNYAEFKNALTMVVQKFIKDFQVKYNLAIKNINKYLKIVDDNAKKCLKKTEPKLLDVYHKIGIK
jgi:tryptophanyl-tRNA synthetase